MKTNKTIVIDGESKADSRVSSSTVSAVLTLKDFNVGCSLVQFL